MAPTATTFGRPPSTPDKPPSMASQKRVAPASPTMRSAPLTWCRCSWQEPSAAVLSGSATKRAMCSCTSDNAWSTSVVIQDRMVVEAVPMTLVRQA